MMSCSSGPDYDPQDLSSYPIHKTSHGYLIGDGEASTAIIFYPGGLVTLESYLPLMAEIYRETGCQIFLAKMPLNLAVFNKNAAAKIMKENSSISSWILCGHSLGGVMAAAWAQENPGKWEALILLASYPDSKKPLNSGKVLSVYASEDGLSTPEEIKESEKSLPADTVFLEIAGGNHAQFGSYGKQNKDGKALISPERQRQMTVEGIAKFLLENSLILPDIGDETVPSP